MQLIDRDSIRTNAQALNYALILVAALSWMLHGCAATTWRDQPSGASPELFSQYDDRFGKLSWGEWAGEWPGSDRAMPFVVDWCRAEYSDYDIMQSKGYFRGRAAFTARLTFDYENRAPIFLSGTFEGNHITLWELPLPPPPKVGASDDENFQTICQHIQKLNVKLRETPEPWQTLRFNVEGAAQIVTINTLTILGGSDVPAPTSQPVRLRSIPRPALIPRAWIGTSHHQEETVIADSFLRLVLFSRSAVGSSKTGTAPELWPFFGFITSSDRDRRLEGKVPMGSLWRSREQFVRFIQEAGDITDDLRVEAFDDPLSEEVQELLHRYLGQVISGERLKKDADEIFGSWEAMIQATCPYAEGGHGVVFGLGQDHLTVVLAMGLLQSKSDQPRQIHFFTMQVIPDADVFHNGEMGAGFRQESGEVFGDKASRVGSWFKLSPSSN